MGWLDAGQDFLMDFVQNNLIYALRLESNLHTFCRIIANIVERGGPVNLGCQDFFMDFVKKMLIYALCHQRQVNLYEMLIYETPFTAIAFKQTSG